jgi:integrase
MQLQVFLPQRRVRDSVKVGRLYRGRYRLDGDSKPTEVSLGVTDESEARRKLEDIVTKEQQERKGIIPPKLQRETENKDLPSVIEDFLRSREGLARNHKYVVGIQQQLTRLAQEAGWKHVHNISLDSFEKWRSSQSHTPTTLNHYLTSANAFLNWMVKTGRILSNPLKQADKVGTGSYEKRERRPVTLEQLQKLISVSGERGLLYIVAGLTGLRRGELEQLQWRDVQLDEAAPCIHARATTTKNGKKASLPLHPIAAEALRVEKEAKPHTSGTTPVFHKLPRIKKYRCDLELAGIPYVDDRGRVFDFHALRNTFCTLLQANGVPLREAMELMRHSDQKLTTKIYTDAGHLPLRASVLKIGSVDTTSADTRADTQNGVKTHEKRVFSVADEKARLTQEDLRGMDPEQYYAFDSQGNIADWALGLLGGGVKHSDYGMVRDAGFEPATPAV